MARFRSLNTSELRTIGFITGIGCVIYWVITGVNPDNIVAGIVGSLLIVQGVMRNGKDQSTSDTDSGMVTPSNKSEPLDGSNGMGSDIDNRFRRTMGLETL